MSHPADPDKPVEPRWRRVPSVLGSGMSMVSGALIVALMLLTVSDVTLRRFFSSGVPGAVEINEVALVAVVFLALMAAELTGTNVRTPILTERLPNRAANLAHVIGLLPALAFLAWATFMTGREGIASYERGDFRFGLIFVPTWPGKLIVPIGLAGLFIAVLVKWISALSALIDARPAEIGERESTL